MIYKNVILYKIQSKQFVRLPENSLKRVGLQSCPPYACFSFLALKKSGEITKKNENEIIKYIVFKTIKSISKYLLGYALINDRLLIV